MSDRTSLHTRSMGSKQVGAIRKLECVRLVRLTRAGSIRLVVGLGISG